MGAHLFQNFGIAVENGDISTEAHCHLRCIEADHAATDDHDLARHDARYAAEQNTATAMSLFERSCTGLHTHAACHLAHGLEERQLAARAGDRFIGNGSDAAVQQILRLIRVGCQMEVGIEDLSFAQLLALDRLRFLDLHHHFALSENRIGAVDDLRARRHILLVGCVYAAAGLGFDPHLVTLHDELFHALRRQADAIFVVLDFLGAADEHWGELLICGSPLQLQPCGGKPESLSQDAGAVDQTAVTEFPSPETCVSK